VRSYHTHTTDSWSYTFIYSSPRVIRWNKGEYINRHSFIKQKPSMDSISLALMSSVSGVISETSNYLWAYNTACCVQCSAISTVLLCNWCYLRFLNVAYRWQQVQHGYNHSRMNNNGVRRRWSQVQRGDCCSLTPSRWVQQLVALCTTTVIILWGSLHWRRSQQN
jgi:hypothetical protein